MAVVMVTLDAAVSGSCCKGEGGGFADTVPEAYVEAPILPSPVLAFAMAWWAFPCGLGMNSHDHCPSYLWCGNGSAALSLQASL